MVGAMVGKMVGRIVSVGSGVRRSVGVGVGVGLGVGTGVAVGAGVAVGVGAGVGVADGAGVRVGAGVGVAVGVGCGVTVGVGTGVAVGVGGGAGAVNPAASMAAFTPPSPPSVGRTIHGRLAGASAQICDHAAAGVDTIGRGGNRSTNGSMRDNATLGYGLNAGGGGFDTGPSNAGASVA